MSQIEQLVKGIFSAELVSSDKRIVPSIKPVKFRMDKNESAYDVSQEIKNNVLRELQSTFWKNYPPPYYNELEEMIARYSGVAAEQVVPGAGSANIITSILNYFAINKQQIIIAHPSFSLYEYHCKTYGIHYQLWKLNTDLEYDIELLPEIKANGLVLFASPNNPVGNVLEKEKLVDMLVKYPQTVFMLDEVYNEFCKGDNASLLEKYPNLILLRSFSKVFSAAGLRVGYLLANEQLASNFRKLIIPFTLNILSVNYVKTVLSNTKEIEEIKKNIAKTIDERERVYNQLIELNLSHQKYTVSPSFGNFLLIRFSDSVFFQRINKDFESAGIKVLDVSNISIMGQALRLTIGNAQENNEVLEIFSLAL